MFTKPNLTNAAITGFQVAPGIAAWTAPFDPKFPYRSAVESPDRSEVLNLIGVSRAEENYLFSIPFTNNEGKIELGKSDCRGIEGINIIQPIISVWKS